MAADRAMAELKRKFAYLSPTQIDAMHADTVAIGTSHGAGDAAVSALAQSKKDLISMRSMRLSLLAPVDVPAHLDSDSDSDDNDGLHDLADSKFMREQKRRAKLEQVELDIIAEREKQRLLDDKIDEEKEKGEMARQRVSEAELANELLKNTFHAKRRVRLALDEEEESDRKWEVLRKPMEGACLKVYISFYCMTEYFTNLILLLLLL